MPRQDGGDQGDGSLQRRDLIKQPVSVIQSVARATRRKETWRHTSIGTFRKYEVLP
jgi:hypothetical protein